MSKKKLFSFILFLFLIFLFLFILLPKLLIVSKYKSSIRELGVTNNQTTISNYTLSSAVLEEPIRNYGHEGVSLETSWLETNISKDNDDLVIKFEDGKSISISGRSKSVDYYKLVLDLSNESGNQGKIKSTLEKLGIKDSKAVYEYILSLSDKDISISLPKSKLLLNNMLLEIKGKYLPKSTNVLKYSTNDYDFYQYNPVSSESNVVIVEFVNKGGVFRSISVGSPNLSQESIDSIVKTIKIN